MAHHLDFFSKEANLINKSQRALANGIKKDPIEKLRFLCFTRGLKGILELARSLRQLDENGSEALSLDELKAGIDEIGLKCSDADAKEIFERFDTEKTGGLLVSEFLEKLRPPMKKNRLNVINRAFQKADVAGRGVISFANIKNAYSVKLHPKFQSGELTANDILKEFLKNFQGPSGESKKSISKEEFLNFYASMSAAIDSDAYFDLLMRQTYRL